MEKLELKHLAPYLPYGLKAKLSKEGVFNLDSEYRNEYAYSICTITDFTTYSKDLGGSIKVDKTKYYSFDFDSLSEIDIILRPLSDLGKGDLDYLLNHHSTDWFVDTDFENMIIKYLEHKNLHNFIEFLPFGLVQWFIENHYDVFGLIEQGLAIDINTLPHD